MTNNEAQLRLQAYLDDELPEGERRAVEAWLTRDPEAAALLTELRQTSAAFASFEGELKLPESREFFWSKIEREIGRQVRRESAVGRPSWVTAWRRFLVPISGLAALALVLVASLQMSTSQPMRPLELEMTLPNSNATTYRDETQRMTLVWFSYPANDDSIEGDFDEFQLD